MQILKVVCIFKSENLFCDSILLIPSKILLSQKGKWYCMLCHNYGVSKFGF